jgi:hypothetical protein
MLNRFLAAFAVAAGIFLGSPASAALVTLTVDPEQSETTLNVKVLFGPPGAASVLANVDLRTRYTGTVVFDVQRDGLGAITSIQFVNPSATQGTLVLEDITGIDVSLGALGNVPAVLDSAELALAVRNLVGGPPATGQTLTNDASIPVAPTGGLSPTGGIIYGGSVLGQDMTSTGGVAILGPATGPIGPALDPVDFTTESNLVDPTGSTGSLAAGNLILHDGIIKPNFIQIPATFSLPGVLRLDSFFLAVDLSLSGKITAVPEASSMTLVGIAGSLVGWAGVRRLRRTK